MKVRSRVAVISGIAIVIVAGISTTLSTASRSSTAANLHTALTVNPLSVVVRDVDVVSVPNKTEYTVDPGGVVYAEASCPKDTRSGNTLNTWTVIGGGYHMYGSSGEVVPSATAAYASDETADYKVTIASPKLTAGPIMFYVQATCMDVQEGPLGT